MLRARPRALGLLASLLLAGCITDEIGNQRWIRIQSAHFELLSSASEKRTRQIAERLELFRAAVVELTPSAEIQPRVPTTVYVFGDSATFRAFRPMRYAVSYMLPTDRRNYMVLDASGAEITMDIAHHEYFHFLLRNGTRFRYPSWYDEGLAELLSTFEVVDDEVKIGGIPELRGSSIRFGSPMSLERMLNSRGSLRWSSRAKAMFYAQSWAFTHFLHAGHFLGYENRLDGMRRYLSLVHRGVPPEEAAPDAFGMSIDELDQEFLEYLQTGRFPNVMLPTERFPFPKSMTVEPLPDAERHYRLGDLARAAQVDDPRSLFRTAIESDPAHALARARLAELLVTERDPSAQAQIDRALELGRDDPKLHFWLARTNAARAAAARGGQRVDLLRQARAHYAKSIALDPEQVAAYAGLGRTFIGDESGERADGVAALEEARARLPSYQPIALSLARLYLELGRVEKARALLVEATAQFDGAGLDSEPERQSLDRLLSLAGLDVIEENPYAHLAIHLEVASPAPGARFSGLIGLVPVSGLGGLGESQNHDVVIVLDESESTWTTEAGDIDGDGKPDSVLKAEHVAARKLLDELNPETTRVAVIVFARTSRVVAPLGTPAEARDALDLREQYAKLSPSRTNFAGALTAAIMEFTKNRPLGERRQRTVLFLSDGVPSFPGRKSAATKALSVAHALGENGVRVHTFALGPSAVGEPHVHREISRVTDGEYVAVEDPAEVVSHLLQVRLSTLEDVEVRNLSTGEPARALRIFPDGSFDGYVRLVGGANEIEFTAIARGERLSLVRTVFFQKPEHPTTADLAAARRLHEELKLRTVETGLIPRPWERRHVGAAGVEAEVEVEVEER